MLPAQLQLLAFAAMAAPCAGQGHRQTVSAGFLRSPDLIKEAGYPAEVHYVTTPDGYVLHLDRIPRQGAMPVLLMHGLFSSSAGFLMQGKDKSLGFMLYRAGFDVWLGNYRGNNLSLNHTKLSSEDDDFWKFGWQDNGELDNPALIDHVLASTKRQRLLYFGYSMGTTTFFVMASERRDVLAKVQAAFIIAPPVFMGHSYDTNLMLFSPFANATQALGDRLHMHRQPARLMKMAMRLACGRAGGLRARICMRIVGVLNEDIGILPAMAAFPSGGSMWQILHFFQLHNWPGFRKFNYGSAAANKAKYGSDAPPDFSLKGVSTPIYIYNGRSDAFCAKKDLDLLKNSGLTNVKKFFFSPNANMVHLDVVFSKTVYEDLWKYMLADMAPFLKQ